MSAAEEVAPEPSVLLHVADHRFDGRACASRTSGCLGSMMFCRRARNKSSVSERSSFFGFMIHPRSVSAGQRNLIRSMRGIPDRKIASFSTSERDFPAIPEACRRPARQAASITCAHSHGRLDRLAKSAMRSCAPSARVPTRQSDRLHCPRPCLRRSPRRPPRPLQVYLPISSTSNTEDREDARSAILLKWPSAPVLTKLADKERIVQVVAGVLR